NLFYSKNMNVFLDILVVLFSFQRSIFLLSFLATRYNLSWLPSIVNRFFKRKKSFSPTQNFLINHVTTKINIAQNLLEFNKIWQKSISRNIYLIHVYSSDNENAAALVAAAHKTPLLIFRPFRHVL
ncbi:hypothetical protein, partial [Virgibacillus oceani]|uniref:hypothetical protein n=1 Tax=Virgibacillus oceani TaxID=1479511 RepID=UPI001E53F839